MYIIVMSKKSINKKPKKLTPAADLLLPSMEVIRDNVLLYFTLLVLPMLMMTLGTRDVVDLNTLFESIFSLPVIVSMFLSLIFLAPLTYTLTHSAAGKELDFKKVFNNSYKYFFRLVGLQVIVGLLVLLGFMLLIIPGFIILRRYFLAQYFVVDKNLGIKDAMRRSAEVTSINPWAIYGIIAVSVLFNLFGIIPLFGQVLGTILMLFYTVAPALRYHEMKNL